MIRFDVRIILLAQNFKVTSNRFTIPQKLAKLSLNQRSFRTENTFPVSMTHLPIHRYWLDATNVR